LSTQIGRVGDRLVASVLESFGAKTAIANTDGFDLIVYYDQSWFRVECKATGQTESNGKVYAFNPSTGSKNKTTITNKHCDIVGFAALDLRRVLFLPALAVTSPTKRFSPKKFTPLNEFKTWIEAVERVKNDTIN
tara:strand:+ start:114 stop:518 length:405 start_codon:yes stop_codon:yes gene_type:complete